MNIGLSYFTEYSMKMKEMANYSTKQVLNLTPRHCRNLQSQSQFQSHFLEYEIIKPTQSRPVYTLLRYHMCKYSTAEKQ